MSNGDDHIVRPNGALDVKAKADGLKLEANKLMAAQHYDAASEKYTQAIMLYDRDPAYFSNRSLAYLKVEAYGFAIDDATRCLDLDPKNHKALHRRGSAYVASSQLKKGRDDFRAVCVLLPSDREARERYDSLNKMIKRLDFEKALECEEVSIVDQIDLANIRIDDSYKGRRWDVDNDEPITLDFVKDMISNFKAQQNLHRKYAYKIALETKKYFHQQPSLVDITLEHLDQITVCGDVHGQYFDMLNIFELNGYPSERHGYLFNGDLVDRGSFSAEVILTALAFKLLYPDSFFINRGNHETHDMNVTYGFNVEVTEKYNETLYKLFRVLFEELPLAYLIDDQILVMHGGLFRDETVGLSEIRRVNRFCQPRDNDHILRDILWSDPQPENGRGPSRRGPDLISFGPDVTKTFCEKNNLRMIIRSHEVKEEGYEIAHDGRCITIFSAPHYAGAMDNKGAYINIRYSLDANGDKITQTEDSSTNRSRTLLDVQYKQFTATPLPKGAPPPNKYARFQGL